MSATEVILAELSEIEKIIANALKRRGGHRTMSIDEHLPEAEASMMATPHLSDSRSYDLLWASNIVKSAWQDLQNAFQEEGKAEWLEVLRPFVAGGETDATKSRRSGGETWSSHRDAAYLAFASASALSRSPEEGSGEHSF